jgi:hypothetical protein
MVYTDPFAKIEGSIPTAGANGVVPYSAGNSFGELLGALMQQQQYDRGIEEDQRRKLQTQAGEAPRQGRAGVQAPQQQMAAQAAVQSAQPQQQFTDPMIEALMAQKMQMALSDQNYQLMLATMERNKPSMLQQYGPLMGNLAGMAIGGPLMGGGFAGAGLGGQIGGMFGGLPRM